MKEWMDREGRKRKIPTPVPRRIGPEKARIKTEPFTTKGKVREEQRKVAQLQLEELNSQE